MTVFCIDIRKPIGVTHIYKYLELAVFLCDCLCCFCKCIFVEESLDIALLEKLNAFLNSDVGSEGNENVSAYKCTRHSGDIFVRCLTDDADVHSFGAD